MPYNNNERRWFSPQKRAAGYAADLKAGVHTYGPKEGQALTTNEKIHRSAYLKRGNDEAGLYIYKKALDEGKPRDEAARLSRIKGKWKEQSKGKGRGK